MGVLEIIWIGFWCTLGIMIVAPCKLIDWLIIDWLIDLLVDWLGILERFKSRVKGRVIALAWIEAGLINTKIFLKFQCMLADLKVFELWRHRWDGLIETPSDKNEDS